MSAILLATDADWIYDEIDAALGGEHTVSRIRRGADVLEAIETVQPELTILDLQIGNMGGMAASLLIKQEQRAGRTSDTAVMMLLDREADIFLAQQAESDGWMIKPLDSFRVRRAANAVLAGQGTFEGLPETA